MEWFAIYLLVCIDKIITAFTAGWAFFWIGLLLLGIAFMATCLRSEEYNERRSFGQLWKEWDFAQICKGVTKWMIPFGFVIGTIGHFIPNQRDLAIIIGTGVTYKAVTSEAGKRIGGKAVELLEAKIEAALTESIPNKEGEKK